MGHSSCIIIIFRQIGGRCYYVGKKRTDVLGAKLICKNVFPEPGRVFEGRSITDQEQVFNATSRIAIHNTGDSRNFWIGMNDDSIEGEWRYDSDNTLVPNWALPKWKGLEPEINIYANCAWIRRDDSLRRNTFCNNEQYFICEESVYGKNRYFAYKL